MAIKDKVRDWLLKDYKATQPVYPRWALANADVEKYNLPPIDMPKRQAELYQRLSWVASATEIASRYAAGTPLSVMRDVGEATEAIPNHPFEIVLKRPNPTQGRFEFLESTFMWKHLTGNAYWWINAPNEDAEPVEIWTIPAYSIRPVPDGNLYIKEYLYDPGNGQEIPLEPWEIVHFRRFNPFSRFLGMSAIEALAVTAVGDMAMQKWQTGFFDNDNAKMPGILAFADPINDTDWSKLQHDIKEQHGGTKRSLMMMRNTGAGGVNWVATAMSQKEMEFLTARDFNKQEIWDTLAPGLTQWLSTSTTDANADSGNDAFKDLTIWPDHQSVAETITTQLLPRYGDNLVAEFEDVRTRNRAMELQEEESYSRVHKVNEVRERFYQDDPIGDERGDLLPAEITKSGIGGFPGRDIIAEPEMEEDANKAAERRKFRTFAQKRVDEGKYDAIQDFRFDYLIPEEQRALKAEFDVPDYMPLLNKLTEVIEALRV